MVGPRMSRAVEPGADPAATASSSEDGLLPRCILAAFASMQQREAEADFTVTATCLELYNEAVTDLLGKDSTKQLQVRMLPPPEGILLLTAWVPGIHPKLDGPDRLGF